MTSTYFEGECKANPLAQRGYSRDSRSDCLQVCIGLVVTTDGAPLGYEVFSGREPAMKYCPQCGAELLDSVENAASVPAIPVKRQNAANEPHALGPP